MNHASRCQSTSFGHQCELPEGHTGSHVVEIYSKEKAMTFQDWLRDELPTVLQGTEHFKECEVSLNESAAQDIYMFGNYEVDFWIPMKGSTFMQLNQKNWEADDTPIIAEACQLIQLIEAKRRELP